MQISATVSCLFAWFVCVNGNFLDIRQASNTTSSAVSLPTPSQAATVNSSAYDLTQHYCRLWRHASKLSEAFNIKDLTENREGVYVNGSIYIDSGDTVCQDILIQCPRWPRTG